jgi:hypothetical protein
MQTWGGRRTGGELGGVLRFRKVKFSLYNDMFPTPFPSPLNDTEAKPLSRVQAFFSEPKCSLSTSGSSSWALDQWAAP